MESSFVSKLNIDAKKKKRKEYFQNKLQDAKEEYESSKRKRELEESRGDSKWMLPSVNERLETESDSKKKKKSKHKKKSKKHKHKKKSHKESESSEESDEWEEIATTSTETEKVIQPNSSEVNINETATKKEEETFDFIPQRDEWMMSSSLLDIATKTTTGRENKTKKKQQETRKKEEEEREKIHESRELNPFWKNGGTGMPEDERKTAAESTKNYHIGDGGRSWIHKAYERAKQQAKEDGIPLEEIVAKRWGSAEKLNALLKAADRNTRPSKTDSGWRKFPVKETKKDLDETVTKQIDDSVKSTKPPSNAHEETTKHSSEENDSNSESCEDETTEVITKPLTEKEKNEINAKILRAELMGDDELAETLKQRLTSGNQVTVKKNKSKQKSKKKTEKTEEEDSSSENGGEEVILTRSDKHGNLYPVKLKTDVEELNQRKKRKKKKIGPTHDSDGKRIRYFEDDDNVDLKTMVEQELLTSVADQQAMLGTLAAKHLGTSMGDDYTLDDMFMTASATKGMATAAEKRIKDKASQEHRQRNLQIESCRFCFENPKIAKHLIIAIGIKTYLAVPINASLTEGHCIIIPMNHVIGQTYLDEDVTQEVNIFKKGLTRMFSDNDEDVMFLETCKNLNRQHHCIVECIPVPKEIGDLAPIYFKKAITETGSEWSQNKKLVTIDAKQGVSKAVPKGLPYFSVEFGRDGGFAHVIEEEASFPLFFGKEIIGGMLDLEPRFWRKPPKESFEQHKKKVLKFAELWKPYDWTSKLA